MRWSLCVNPWSALREAAYGLLQAQRHTFHGEAANLFDKAHQYPRIKAKILA